MGLEGSECRSFKLIKHGASVSPIICIVLVLGEKSTCLDYPFIAMILRLLITVISCVKFASGAFLRHFDPIGTKTHISSCHQNQ